MSIKQSDWKEINHIVNKTLQFLSKPYSRQVNNFLDWYLSLPKIEYDINNQQLKTWVLNGIPQMKTIVILMNYEISKIETLIDRLLTSNMTLDQKYQRTKTFYEGIKDVTNTVIEFIGCRNQFGNWYLNLLRYYDGSLITKDLNYFENTCLEERNKLLKIRNG